MQRITAPENANSLARRKAAEARVNANKATTLNDLKATVVQLSEIIEMLLNERKVRE